MNKKIFISSTCYDLIDLRSELKEFFDEIGLIPILSDNISSEFSTEYNTNSIQICLNNLADCDTVIFVLCQRYGSSLKKAGFGDYSATHLEYLEAKRLDKKILFFVRDRFLADHDTYRKTNDLKSLSWLNKDIDLRLFEIFEDWKALSPSDTNNWFGTFRNSIELKKRLGIEFKDKIGAQRLDKLIESGNVPLVTIEVNPKIIPNTQNREIQLSLIVQNYGTQTAIEPKLLLFKADSYDEFLNLEASVRYDDVKLEPLKSLSSSSEFSLSMKVMISEEELQNKTAKFIAEVIYTTVYGDSIADATSINLMFSDAPNIQVGAIINFKAKRYRGSGMYDRLVRKNNNA